MDIACFNYVSGRVQSECCRFVPLYKGKMCYGAREMTCGIVPVMAAVVMRRRADIFFVQAFAGLEPAGKSMRIDIVLNHIDQAVLRPGEETTRRLTLAIGN